MRTTEYVSTPNGSRRAPFLIEQFVGEELSTDLIAYFGARQPRARSYQGIVDERLRKCDFVQVDQPNLQELCHSLRHAASHVIGADLNLVPNQTPVIYRYGQGIGFVTHHDEVTEAELERARTNGQPVISGDITVSVCLNEPEEYEGGELYFTHPVSMAFKPRAGSAIVFPATRAFLHGVREITAGHRFSLLMRFNYSS